MKLYNVRLLVKDFPSSFLFYRDVFGLTPSFGSEDDVYAEFTTGEGRLALFQSGLMDAAIGVEASSVERGRDQAVLVFGVPDVDDAVRRLQMKDVKFLTEPEDRPDWGIRTAHMRDPEGNLVEIYSDLPR